MSKTKVKSKHITILGNSNTKFLADFKNKNNEIWCIGKHDNEEFIPRVDKWFDLCNSFSKRTNADYNIDNFPFDSCHELVHGKRYASIIAYLIAFAILQDATKISLYGICSDDPHKPKSEVEKELHNIREMIYFCWGRGIDIEICFEEIDYILPEYTVDCIDMFS